MRILDAGSARHPDQIGARTGSGFFAAGRFVNFVVEHEMN